MKKFALKLMVLSLLFVGMGNNTKLFADDTVTDSLSIDDMDPVFLYDEEEEEEESSNGAVIAVIIVAVVGGGVGYKVVSKKKKK